MKWADYNLVWGRPLKSILALFDGELIKFDFHHLQSSNTTYADGVMQNDEKVVPAIGSVEAKCIQTNVNTTNNMIC